MSTVAARQNGRWKQRSAVPASALDPAIPDGDFVPTDTNTAAEPVIASKDEDANGDPAIVVESAPESITWIGLDEPVADTAVIGTEPSPGIIGFVDGLDLQRRVTGWACVPDAPARRVKVSVLGDGDVVALGLADLARPDVQVAGHGDGFSGFALTLPDRLFDGRIHRLSVLYEAPDVAPLAADLELELPAIVADPSLRQVAFAAPSLQVEEPPAATYVPGHYVLCMKPYPRPPYHTRGWHEPEAEFTWINGLEATIEMVLRRPHRSYTLTLDVVPNGVGHRLQTLEVFFNYLRVGFFEVPSPMTVSMEIPSEVFILRRTRINLHCRNAVIGTEHGVADARRLGIAVRGWCMS